MRTTVSKNGRIEIPAALRKQDRILPGQEFSVERIEEGRYVLKRLTPSKGGVSQWMQACPETDWFLPLPSESTDTLGVDF